MDNNIYSIEEYRELIELQKKYEDGLIDEDDLSLDEINKLIKLYMRQNRELQDSIKRKLLLKSREWS